eukprot:1545399-Amphidinium_carterae.1
MGGIMWDSACNSDNLSLHIICTCASASVHSWQSCYCGGGLKLDSASCQVGNSCEKHLMSA